MTYNIGIRAEMSFVFEIEAAGPEESREAAINDILKGSESEIYEHAYSIFEYDGFDGWSVENIEDESGKVIEFKPWHSWE